ncbi:MAG: SRPBCC domain-containing protein [Myxococcota bacterium]
MSVVIRTEIDIDAPPRTVWSILVDLKRYPDWNPFTVQMTSSLKMGAPVAMRVALRKGWRIRQTEYVSAHESERKLCWKMKGLPPFVLGAERCQALQPLAGGQTRYVNADVFRGVLSPLLMWIFGKDIERGFEQVARALKRRAETDRARATPDRSTR